jgi:hypothetical protein
MRLLGERGDAIEGAELYEVILPAGSTDGHVLEVAAPPHSTAALQQLMASAVMATTKAASAPRLDRLAKTRSWKTPTPLATDQRRTCPRGRKWVRNRHDKVAVPLDHATAHGGAAAWLLNYDFLARHG